VHDIKYKSHSDLQLLFEIFFVTPQECMLFYISTISAVTMQCKEKNTK
jgi:hypothetical protein